MALLAAKDGSGIPRSLILDDISRALVTVPWEMYKQHEGAMFTAYYEQLVVTEINEMSVIAFNTPLTGKRIHLMVEAQVTDKTTLMIAEDPSIDENEDSSVITPTNRLVGDSNSVMADLSPVKATGGVLEWTGAGEELDEFSIGDDIYLVAALEATADAASKIWVDLGNGLAATMVTNATAAIDGAQATSNNVATVEATDGAGDTIDIIADNFGSNANLAVTVIVGANMAAGVSLTGGVGGLIGTDGEYPGLANSVSAFDKTNAAAANIGIGTLLHSETVGIAAATPARDQQMGEPFALRSFILRAGYQYAVILKNQNANDNDHKLRLIWIEHTHKDPTTEF